MMPIRAISLGFLVVAIGQTALLPNRARAQQDHPAAKAAIVSAQGLAGESRPSPVELSLPEGVRVGSLSITVRYPIALATFQKTELGGASLAVGVEAKTDAPKQEGDEGVIQLTIATPERDGGRSPLPDGRLMNLWFQIAKDAAPGTVIPLKLTSATAGAARGETASVNVETEGGEILVSSPIVSVCFFYMH